jgi:hypothetical protein
LGRVVFGAIMALIFLSVTVPTLKASTEGPLEELGELLGVDGNGPNGSDDAMQKESTLDIPNITQREEAPISIPSGSLANG